MTPWLLVIAGLTLALWLRARQSRSRVRAWHAAASAHGLARIEEHDSGGHRRLEAEAGGQRVRFEEYDHGRSSSGTRIVVQSPASRAGAMRLVRESLDTNINRLFGSSEIEVGDEAFDARFFLGGSPPFLRALLDAETRRRLMVLEMGMEVLTWDGELAAQVSARETPVDMSKALGVALHIGERMAADWDIVRRLAQNALHDPLPPVRVNNLLTLAREFGDHATTRETLRSATADASPEVRLEAGRALGAEGRPVLRQFAEGGTDDACTARAVSALGQELALAPTLGLLHRALQAGARRTVGACLERLGRGEPDEAVPPLLEMLRGRTEIDFRIAAAEALGHVGSAGLIPDLREAIRDSADGRLLRAVRQAISEIQSRSGIAPGQLTLADPPELGQLSLAEQEAGELSLTTATASGHLSLTASEPDAEPTKTPGPSPPAVAAVRDELEAAATRALVASLVSVPLCCVAPAVVAAILAIRTLQLARDRGRPAPKKAVTALVLSALSVMLSLALAMVTLLGFLAGREGR